MKLVLVALSMALVASTQADSCRDSTSNCRLMANFCHMPSIAKLCPKTCGVCGVPTYPPPIPGTLPPNMDRCGVPRVSTSRVVGGDDAKRGAWPWQILMLKNNRASCGGTLISPRWVVTAAHCVDRDVNFPERFTIRVGENDRQRKQGSEVDMKVERVIAHAKWSPKTLDYDIALFKLAKPVRFGKYVQPACLPSEELKAGTKCMLTGWGKIKHPGNMHDAILQQAVMPLVDSKVCYAKNKKVINIPITSRMLCAGEGGRTPMQGCHGDSGGPLVCKVNGRWELHGDVSHGSPRCKSTETYTVFARTTFFKSWILENMKKYGGN